MKKLSFLQIIMLVCCIAIFSFEAHAVEDTLEPLSGKADLQAPDPPSDEGQATQGTAGPDHIPDRIRDIRTRADRAAAAASDNIIPKPQVQEPEPESTPEPQGPDVRPYRGRTGNYECPEGYYCNATGLGLFLVCKAGEGERNCSFVANGCRADDFFDDEEREKYCK